MVERQPSKLNVAGSSPVSRSKKIISRVAAFFNKFSLVALRKFFLKVFLLIGAVFDLNIF